MSPLPVNMDLARIQNLGPACCAIDWRHARFSLSICWVERKLPSMKALSRSRIADAGFAKRGSEPACGHVGLIGLTHIQ
jgi:hypothetical protein